MTLFNDVYRDKRVLVTGHTGFKGSWLSLWLTMLGAEVHGISDSELDSPSLFGLLAWDDTLKSHFVDIRDFGSLNRKIQQIKPDFIFHLAAQSIVSESFADPMGTITTNTLGTANLLECLRINDLSCTAVIITSDKCYRNDGRNRPFKESDPLGGMIFTVLQKLLMSYSFTPIFTLFSTVLIPGSDWPRPGPVMLSEEGTGR